MKNLQRISTREEGRSVHPVHVQRYLHGLMYPATKDDLLDWATWAGADEEILSVLRLLPDAEYLSPTDVNMDVVRLQFHP